MKRTSAALGSFVFLLVTPGTVCGLVPLLITGWRRPVEPVPGLGAVGWLLVLAGAAVLGHAFVAFAWHGRGTPAPSAPTERLVIEGAYRHVRNPMYVAVLALVLGQVLLFASWGLFAYLVVLAVTGTSSCTPTRNPRCARPTARPTTSSARTCPAGCRA